MRLVDLNLWMGKVPGPLTDFIKEQAPKTDVFCFQEMVASAAGDGLIPDKKNLYLIFRDFLPEFQGNFVAMQDFSPAVGMPPHLSEGGEPKITLSFGLAMFIKKTIEVEKLSHFFALSGQKIWFPHKAPEVMPGAVQYAVLRIGDKKYTIANFHGLAAWPKVDTPKRLRQSQVIAEFLRNVNHSKILCGDFNLFPDTKSLSLIEGGMLNLIRKHQIPFTGTRSKLFFKENGDISDYVLVSSDINVQNFSLPDVAVSDHLPLILDFD